MPTLCDPNGSGREGIGFRYEIIFGSFLCLVRGLVLKPKGLRRGVLCPPQALLEREKRMLTSLEMDNEESRIHVNRISSTDIGRGYEIHVT